MLSFFPSPKPVIGMLHVPALPGSPRCDQTFQAIRRFVLDDARALTDAGVDGLMLENFGDVPFYPNRVPPHTIAFLTALAREIRERYAPPLGINVLRNDGMAAIAVASASGARFIRVNVFIGARLADQGVLRGEAHEIQRYRRLLGSDVAILADVAVKHSAPLAPRPLAEEIDDTVKRGLADGIIVSGPATGHATSIDDVHEAKRAASGAPVFVGSGVTAGNVSLMLAAANGVIVGTSLKAGGQSHAPVDPAAVERFLRHARG